MALLTRHDKQRVIAPVLKEVLGINLVPTDAFDTDQLGTFSRDIARTLSQQACARKKAQLACELTGLEQGIGSEGSFGGGPYGDMVPWNVEMLVWVDRQTGHEVTAIAQGPACMAQASCQSLAEVLAFVAKAPAGQGFVMRPQHQDHPQMLKGLVGTHALTQAFHRCMEIGREQAVFIEYDLRAHFSPLRMEAIAQAAHNLAERLKCRCPKCDMPGFWPDKVQLGLPCAACGEPTNQVRCKTATCQACDYQQDFSAESQTANPFFCPSCNP
ncbi:hypothetical protein P2G88_18415 [Aliiglaciecola sp. CAU 1673]|uniref:DUF6671 family protein n=1 Tax=Aliiglaciecola sp. CAU 1673 TaxID=3032595 RepID=UPI0023DB515F|nr:DUF6671 family protein [Aliiglaciecola sp. CAU 1673]MDF2180234.1 hypothetical protein [Aliiglaciecola sp. CAU 1673]